MVAIVRLFDNYLYEESCAGFHPETPSATVAERRILGVFLGKSIDDFATHNSFRMETAL